MNTSTVMSANGSMVNAGLNRIGPKAALESYTRNELDDDKLIAALLTCCRSDADATSQALSLLDQYHRRGLVDTSLFLTAKTELRILDFGN